MTYATQCQNILWMKKFRANSGLDIQRNADERHWRDGQELVVGVRIQYSMFKSNVTYWPWATMVVAEGAA